MKKKLSPETIVALIVLGILMFCLVACVSNPTKPIQGEKVAVTIEGLGSIQYVKQAYSDDLKALGYKVYNLNWKYDNFIKADVVIAHSCGWMPVKDGVEAKLLVTLDARRCDSVINAGFKKPIGVKRHVALYQARPLRGYPIEGAENIDMGSVGHTNLVGESKDIVLELVR